MISLSLSNQNFPKPTNQIPGLFKDHLHFQGLEFAAFKLTYFQGRRGILIFSWIVSTATSCHSPFTQEASYHISFHGSRRISAYVPWSWMRHQCCTLEAQSRQSRCCQTVSCPDVSNHLHITHIPFLLLTYLFTYLLYLSFSSSGLTPRIPQTLYRYF